MLMRRDWTLKCCSSLLVKIYKHLLICVNYCIRKSWWKLFVSTSRFDSLIYRQNILICLLYYKNSNHNIGSKEHVWCIHASKSLIAFFSLPRYHSYSLLMLSPVLIGQITNVIKKDHNKQSLLFPYHFFTWCSWGHGSRILVELLTISHLLIPYNFIVNYKSWEFVISF